MPCFIINMETCFDLLLVLRIRNYITLLISEILASLDKKLRHGFQLVHAIQQGITPKPLPLWVHFHKIVFTVLINNQINAPKHNIKRIK